MKKPKPKTKPTKRHNPDFDVFVMRFPEPVVIQGSKAEKLNAEPTKPPFVTRLTMPFRRLVNAFRALTRRSS